MGQFDAKYFIIFCLFESFLEVILRRMEVRVLDIIRLIWFKMEILYVDNLVKQLYNLLVLGHTKKHLSTCYFSKFSLNAEIMS